VLTVETASNVGLTAINPKVEVKLVLEAALTTVLCLFAVFINNNYY
jgi:hypothetical protein